MALSLFLFFFPPLQIAFTSLNLFTNYSSDDIECHHLGYFLSTCDGRNFSANFLQYPRLVAKALGFLVCFFL